MKGHTASISSAGDKRPHCSIRALECVVGNENVWTAVQQDACVCVSSAAVEEIPQQVEWRTYTHTHTYAHMHIHMHTYIHALYYAHIYMHTYIHTPIYAHKHTYIHTHTYTHIHIRTHAHTHTQTYTHRHTHTNAVMAVSCCFIIYCTDMHLD